MSLPGGFLVRKRRWAQQASPPDPCSLQEAAKDLLDLDVESLFCGYSRQPPGTMMQTPQPNGHEQALQPGMQNNACSVHSVQR
jgi:hypothetical protein